ncbi:MAG: VOC family protein [Saprospiraceae bacterium]
MPNFELKNLDHVAIRVADLNRSANWYQDTLGLKKIRLEKWGDFPIFLLAGKSGIALFPEKENDATTQKSDIDHFAFNVTNEDFQKAKIEFDQKGIKYIFKDHFYFHSLYLQDPDNHTVELTTIMVDEKGFY